MQNRSTEYNEKNFTIDGAETSSDDPFAKLVSVGGHERYFVAYLTDGMDAGHMRNHLSGTQEDPLENPFIPRLGRRKYELREVSKVAYDCYMDFLVRGDQKAYRNAERSAI